MVKEAEKYTDLVLFASPWSPPVYMKTNGTREYGGHLKREYYALWAKYFAKYIEACRTENIDIWGVTVQNEPRHTQMWESCLYSLEEEIEFLGYLGRALTKTGTRILCYDHCRERVYERSKRIYESENGKYCDGIAHHWYSGLYFGELKAFYDKYPNKYNVASESCCAVWGSGIQPERNLEFAERYAQDIIGSFKNGLNAYCDWNLTLDENNGPFHNRTGRGCSVETPVYCNKQTGEVILRLSYYYIGHVSKFIKRGAKVINASAYTDDLDYCAFKNPDGQVVLVVLNRGDKNRSLIVRLDGHIYRTEMSAHSIATFIINK
jgi:glucosylceramidase